MEFHPLAVFRQCVDRYNCNYKVKEFTCLDLYYSMAFAQITYRESLRDIEACLRAQHRKLYHMGISGPAFRNTLANTNKVSHWRIYADFALSLISTARRLYSKEAFFDGLNETVYALEATTIDLCPPLFPWAHFRKTKGAIKFHTHLDLRGNIPYLIHISDRKLHGVNTLNIIPIEVGAFYIKGLSGPHQALLSYTGCGLFCYQSQVQPKIPACLLSSTGSEHGPNMRSISLADRSKVRHGLSRQAASSEILRLRYLKDSGLSNEQLHLTAFDYLYAIPLPLACRAIFQLDLFN